jgi:negative regulator of flagellin synthesis FlgM
MTEKINNPGWRPADVASARRSEAAKSAGNPAASRSSGAEPASPKDTVSITQSGLLMSKLEEIVHSTRVVDSERVAALKDAIASGTYEIDDQHVADRLLELERDLFA